MAQRIGLFDDLIPGNSAPTEQPAEAPPQRIGLFDDLIPPEQPAGAPAVEDTLGSTMQVAPSVDQGNLVDAIYSNPGLPDLPASSAQFPDQTLSPRPEIPYVPNVVGLTGERVFNLGGEAVNALSRGADAMTGKLLPGVELPQEVMPSGLLDPLADVLTGMDGPAEARNMEGVVQGVKDRDLGTALASLPPAIPEVIFQSLPDMIALKTQIPGYILSFAEQIDAERIANGGADDTAGYMQSLSTAALSAMLDRVGLDNVLQAAQTGGKDALVRILGATLTESLTEGTQESLEYVGSSVGTDKPPTMEEGLTRAGAGALLGGAAGGTISTGGAAVTEGVDRLKDRESERQLGDVLSQLAEAEAVQSLNPENAQVQVQNQPVEEEVAAEAVPFSPVVQAEAPTPQPAVSNRVSTASGRSIDIEPAVVDAGDLITSDDERYDQNIQPRQRGDRKASFEQINEIATKLDPERLGVSSEADRGAPIVGPDGMVESGNGRVMAIRQAYASVPERAEAYKAWLQEQGYDIEGMEQPVLIRRRVTDMTPEERRQFAIEANQSATATMSATERAQSDADLMDDAVMGLYRSADIGSAANAPMALKFLQRIPVSERNELVDAEGKLNQAGIRRIQAAILGKAFGGTEQSVSTLGRIMESTDDNVRSITGALTDVAADYANLRGYVDEGVIGQEYWITDKLLRAVETVSAVRSKGVSVSEYLQQQGLFGDLTPLEEEMVRAFYNQDMTRALGREKIAEILRYYAQEAIKQRTDQNDMFGAVEPQPPQEIFSRGREQTQNKSGGPTPGGQLLTPSGTVPQPAQSGTEGPSGGVAPTPEPEGIEPPPLPKKVKLTKIQEAGRQLLASLGGEATGRDFLAAREGGYGSSGISASTITQLNNKGVIELVGEGDIFTKKMVFVEPKSDEKLQDTRVPRGGLSPKTTEVSFTNRESFFRAAFSDLGIDPDEASLWTTDRQIEALKRSFKSMFGITVQVDPRAKGREVIDQLLDGYRNIQMMLHVLGLPTKGVSLGETLTLTMEKFSGQYLGAYAPGARSIYLPGRTNSFAHEWFHALDHWLTTYAMPEPTSQLWSRVVRDNGIENVEANTIEEAFVKLLNSVFYKAPDAADMDPKQAAAKIKSLMSGKAIRASKSMPPSDYRVQAGQFGDPQYWANPAEMLARAFEAYIAYKIENEAQAWSTTRGSNEMITKGDQAYLSSADDRLRMTFPKSDERMRIFEAFDDLIDRIRERQILGDGKAQQKPSDHDILDPIRWDRHIPERDGQTLLKQEIDAQMKMIKGLSTAKDKIVRRMKGEPSEDTQHTGRMLHDAGRQVFSGIRTRMRIIINRAPASAKPYLQELMNDVSEDPGTGRYTGETFSREAQYRSNENINRMINILSTYDLGNMTTDDKRLLRDLLISEDAQGAPANMKKAAAALRGLLDREWYYNTSNGLDIGYTRNGFLPRIVVWEQVAYGKAQNDNNFVQKATQVYQVVFENDVGQEFDAESWAAMKKKIKSLGDDMATELSDIVKQIDKIVRKINRLTKKLEKADDPDAIEVEIQELSEQAAELYGEIYDGVKDQWSLAAAADWEFRILDGPDFDYDNKTPAGNYTKSRTLPPEADKIMEDFYSNDPIDIIADYFIKSARKVAYQKRRFPPDKNGRRPDKWEALRRKAMDAGADPQDVNSMKHMMNVITGRNSSGIPTALNRSINYIMLFGTISLLGRAATVSIPESINAIAATGQVRNGLKPLAYMIGDIFRTANAKERRDMAQAVGLVTHPIYDTIIQNRLGGDQPYTARQSAILANFFNRSGLIPLTMAQRRATVGVSYQYLRTLSDTIKNKKNGIEVAQAEFNELGIPADKHADFAEWMLQHEAMPELQELNSPAGQLWKVALRRMSERIIIDPQIVDRPELANHPIFRLAYGIMSFTFGFWEMVTKRMVKQIERNAKLHEGRTAQQVADVTKATSIAVATGASLFLGQLIITMIREAMFNPDKWEEKDEEGELMNWLLELAAYRTGLTGPVEPLLQAQRGIRYERDYTALLAGAQFGYFLQSAQNIGKAFTDMNSPNTNTAEHNAVASVYKAFLQPLLMAGLSVAPVGPLSKPIAGAAIMGLSSPGASKGFANAIVGEKGSQKDKGGVKSRLEKRL